MTYRSTRAYRLACIIAAAQKRNLRFRTATLENTKAAPCVVRRRRDEVRS